MTLKRDQNEMSEDTLLKALGDLEEEAGLRKGDALASHPHDGGFASEGTNIQTLAKRIKKAIDEGDLEKAKKLAKMMSETDMADYKDKDDGGDEDEDEDEDEGAEADAAAMKSKAKKSVNDGADALGRAADGSEFKKALSDETNDAMEFDASGFLQDLVNTVAKATDTHSTQIGRLAKSLLAIHERERQTNRTLAKALRGIGNGVNKLMQDFQELQERINSTPIPRPQGTVRKSDVQQSPYDSPTTGQTSNGFDIANSPLATMVQTLPGLERIQDALVQKGLAKQVPLELITQFENGRNLAVLPPKVLRDLEAELCGN